MNRRRPLVAVIGSGEADDRLRQHARRVGRIVAESGAGIVCGGLGGVMAAACAGAAEVEPTRRGPLVGILPGDSADSADAAIEVALPTAMGIARNVLVVRAADAVIAVGGETGTLSEMAHAWQLGKPLAAYRPAGGWGSRLAGEALDRRHAGTVVAIDDEDGLRTWLASVLLSSSEPR